MALAILEKVKEEEKGEQGQQDIAEDIRLLSSNLDSHLSIYSRFELLIISPSERDAI